MARFLMGNDKTKQTTVVRQNCSQHDIGLFITHGTTMLIGYSCIPGILYWVFNIFKYTLCTGVHSSIRSRPAVPCIYISFDNFCV